MIRNTQIAISKQEIADLEDLQEFLETALDGMHVELDRWDCKRKIRTLSDIVQRWENKHEFEKFKGGKFGGLKKVAYICSTKRRKALPPQGKKICSII